MLNRTHWLALFLTIAASAAFAQAAPSSDAAAPKADDAAHKVLKYKTTPQGDLDIELFFPADWKAADRRPVIVFFFGGGWTSGNRRQFVPECEYFAKRGMVAATADYRIKSKHQTTPDKCVEDAKSAIRWVRQHAAELGVDSLRVVASGGSAGGHLAAATALLPNFDPPGEDMSISSVPNAMVLFNPALDLTGFPADHLPAAITDPAQFAKELSPNQYISAKTPPAILFFGTADKLGTGGQSMIEKSALAGNRAELYLADGQAHGFFNKSPWLEATLRQADEFLESLGYLQGKPTIEANPSAVLKRAEVRGAGK